MTFLFDAVSMWVISIPAAYLMAHYTGVSLLQMYLVIQLFDALKAMFGLILVKKRVWVNNLTR